jgi:hypothetical protein
MNNVQQGINNKSTSPVKVEIGRTCGAQLGGHWNSTGRKLHTHGYTMTRRSSDRAQVKLDTKSSTSILANSLAKT